jgi:hypothetical protein
METPECQSESIYVALESGKWVKVWIPAAQPTGIAFKPSVDIITDAKTGLPVKKEIKDKAGNTLSSQVVRKAKWKAIVEGGKEKIFGTTVSGASSLFGKLMNRIKDAINEKKPFIAFKIMKTGEGLATKYDLDALTEPLPVAPVTTVSGGNGGK